MTRDHWEHFEHEADIGVRGMATTLSGAFEQAALALTAIVTDPESVSARDRVEVDCEAPDLELLLADWLNAIIYEMATGKMLFSKFHVEIHDLHLHGRLYGEKIDIRRHRPAVEIKGATYTALHVEHRDDHWLAECVLDV